MQKCKVHEVLHSFELINDFFHFEFHDGRDALDNSPVYLLIGQLARLLVLIHYLFANIKQDIKVLIHTWKNDISIGQQQHVYCINGILNNCLIIAGIDEFANWWEHLGDDIPKLNILKQLGAILHNDWDCVDWNTDDIFIVLIQRFLLPKTIDGEVLSEESQKLRPDVESATKHDKGHDLTNGLWDLDVNGGEKVG